MNWKWIMSQERLKISAECGSDSGVANYWEGRIKMAINWQPVNKRPFGVNWEKVFRCDRTPSANKSKKFPVIRGNQTRPGIRSMRARLYSVTESMQPRRRPYLQTWWYLAGRGRKESRLSLLGWRGKAPSERTFIMATSCEVMAMRFAGPQALFFLPCGFNELNEKQEKDIPLSRSV